MGTLTIDTTEVEKDVIYAVGDLLELNFTDTPIDAIYHVVVILKEEAMNKDLAYHKIMLLELTTFQVWKDRSTNVVIPSSITHGDIEMLVGDRDCKIIKKGHIKETNVKVEKETENG